MTLDRSRVFILPTGAGLAFAVMLLVMLFGSINYNNSLGHMFSYLLGSMSMVSIFYTYRNLAMLGFTVGRIRPVFAGERAGFEIRVTNPDVYARIGILLESANQPPVSIELSPRQTSSVTLYRDTTGRGVVELGRCRVSSCYPLGLFRAWSHLVITSYSIHYTKLYEIRR